MHIVLWARLVPLTWVAGVRWRRAIVVDASGDFSLAAEYAFALYMGQM